MTAQAMVSFLRGKWLLALLVVSLVIPASAFSQQGTNSSVEQSPKATQPNAGESSSTNRTASEPQPAAPDPYPVRTIGGAELLTHRPGDIGFGPIYLYSADTFQVYNYRTHFDSLAGQDVTDKFVSTVLRTNIAFDQRLRRGRFALQYQPRVVLLNGHVQTDYTNQKIGLDTVYTLNPRFSLGITQTTMIYGSRDQFGDLYLDSDPSSGYVLDNPIANGASRWVYNTTAVHATYNYSARTRFVASPRFDYSYIGSAASLTAHLSRGAGSRFELLHQMSPQRTIGMYQDIDWQHFTGIGPDTNYLSSGFEYIDEIRPTWFVYATAGVASFSQPGGSRGWTPEARLSLVKALRTSKLALAFSRSHASSGYISSRYHNRYDAGYSFFLGPRFIVDLGGGYFKENSLVAQLSGTYAVGKVRYQLFRHVSWFAMYTYRQQAGNSVQVPAERRNYFISGVQWTSASATELY